jgi:phosphoribosyl 1,2-cyclic phosphate phosphodiesterase
MKVTVLGSGTSHGVPVIGCTCPVCLSPDPKNKRNRPAILVTGPTGVNVLADAPPELRIQLLANHVARLDAILLTHSHADHIFGLDDVRAFNLRQRAPMPIYLEPSVEADIRRVFDYIFSDGPVGGGRPKVELHNIEPGKSLKLGEMDILPLRVFHGELPVLAFKFGDKFAYVTDVSRIPDESWPHLENLDVLILDAVRREPHSTHFHLDAALDVISRLQPQRALLTHLSHDYDHAVTNQELPDGVELAYDGQVFEVS